jgi:hypothetical protein
MSAAFTPGPWSVHGESIWGDPKTTGASTFFEQVVPHVGNPENAKLISAAPDLLEAIEVLLDTVRGGKKSVMDFTIAERQARTAIAKATGEAA